MGKYFSKLPTVFYDGLIVKNIMTRPKIKDLASSDQYYEYSINDYSYPDTISNDYYDDPDYTWLIYLANQIIDPYYDYYVRQEDFQDFIIQKYGSISLPSSTINDWVLSWGKDTRTLLPNQFDSLPGNLKRYWNPVISNAYSPPSKYVRRKGTERLNTNRMCIIEDSNTQDLNIGDEYQGKTVTDLDYVGVISEISGNMVTLIHVIGPATGDVYDQLENSVYEITNIKPSEVAYWVPISIYEYELAKNEARRNIKLVNKSLTFKADKELKRIYS